MVARDLERLRTQGLSLSETYPYLAWLAPPIKKIHPEWYQEFQETGLGNLVFSQAANFAFVAFLEARYPDELYLLLPQIIDQGPDYWASELANTADWYCSEVSD